MSVLASEMVLASFLVFCRVGACFMVMPGMSSMRVPVQVRLLAALTVSIAVAAFVPSAAAVTEITLDRLIIAIAGEIAIGAVVGLVVRYFILALEFIAAGIAMSAGFGGMLGAPLDGGEAQTALTSFVSFSALIVLFTVDFHHYIITALISTYDLVPAATFPDPAMLLEGLTEALSLTFMIVLRLGIPFLIFAIIANVAVGILNKLAMQIPVYFIALPFMLGAVLMLLYLLLPYMLAFFADYIPTVIRVIL